jgi:outer membrane murein-binding lipoprotein Lpp
MSTSTKSFSRSRLGVAALLLGTLLLAGCIIHTLEIGELTDEAQEVSSPVKVHLSDGSTAVFSQGVVIEGGVVTGHVPGIQYDLRLENPTAIVSIPLDEVVAMESFSTPVERGLSLLVTVFSPALLALALVPFFVYFG